MKKIKKPKIPLTKAQRLDIKEFPYLEYDDRNNVTYNENKEGYYQIAEYDENNNRVYNKNSYGTWERREYNPNGNIIYQEFSNGLWNKTTYDDNGNETEYNNSNGQWKKQKYDELNRIISNTTNGVGYEQTYDDNGNINYIKYSNGLWNKTTYDDNGNITYFLDSNQYWYKQKFGENNVRTFFKDSNNTKITLDIYNHIMIETSQSNHSNGYGKFLPHQKIETYNKQKLKSSVTINEPLSTNTQTVNIQYDENGKVNLLKIQAYKLYLITKQKNNITIYKYKDSSLLESIHFEVNQNNELTFYEDHRGNFWHVGMSKQCPFKVHICVRVINATIKKIVYAHLEDNIEALCTHLCIDLEQEPITA